MSEPNGRLGGIEGGINILEENASDDPEVYTRNVNRSTPETIDLYALAFVVAARPDTQSLVPFMRPWLRILGSMGNPRPPMVRLKVGILSQGTVYMPGPAMAVAFLAPGTAL